MNISAKVQEKRANGDPAPPRQIYTVPIPKDTEKCKGCPYPRVGFICWSTDGSCMKTDMERISGKARR